MEFRSTAQARLCKISLFKKRIGSEALVCRASCVLVGAPFPGPKFKFEFKVRHILRQFQASHQHFSVSAAWVPPLLHTYGMFFKFRTSIHLSAFRVHYSRWFSTFLDLLRSGNWADNWTEIWLIKRKIWIHFDVSKHLSVLSPQTFVFQCAYTKNCE